MITLEQVQEFINSGSTKVEGWHRAMALLRLHMEKQKDPHPLGLSARLEELHIEALRAIFSKLELGQVLELKYDDETDLPQITYYAERAMCDLYARVYKVHRVNAREIVVIASNDVDQEQKISIDKLNVVQIIAIAEYIN